MESIYYIGLDVHKKTIAYCTKTKDGDLVDKGTLKANRDALREWAGSIDRPWIGALEATMFTGWIYEFLLPYALELKVAHPAMLKALTAGKHVSDPISANKICDLLRGNLLPESYMASEEIRELRRVLRFRALMKQEAKRMKNKINGLLMEVGASYNKKRLYGKRYFQNLLQTVEYVPVSVLQLLRISKVQLDSFEVIQKQLLADLSSNEHIRERVLRLRTIPGVGEVTALTWVLEVGDPMRFSSARHAVSFCGLCSAQKESGGKSVRGPISKKRNKHLQCILIQAAKLAPGYNKELAWVRDKELSKGNRNRATLAVARKLVAFMLAVDKRQTGFVPIEAKAA